MRLTHSNNTCVSQPFGSGSPFYSGSQALAAKGQLQAGIHSHMQAISEQQTKIRQMGKRTSGYLDSLHSLDR